MQPVRKLSLLITAALLLGLVAPAAFAHCQIPCGIYGDPMRFDMMLEHVATIEKSMKQIGEIGGADAPDWNQLVRWVNNKEDHANELTEIVTYYFMAQRIKPPAANADDATKAKYDMELSLLHQIMVHAMKAKQTTDQAHVDALRELIHEFKHSYLGEDHAAGGK